MAGWTNWAGTASADTLRDALVSTYATNPTLTGQRETLRATDATVAIARAAGRPQVSGTVGLNRDLSRSGILNTGGKGPTLSALVQQTRNLLSTQAWNNIVFSSCSLTTVSAFNFKRWLFSSMAVIVFERGEDFFHFWNARCREDRCRAESNRISFLKSGSYVIRVKLNYTWSYI